MEEYKLWLEWGKVEHETPKAVKIGGQWFPKSAIIRIRETFEWDGDCVTILEVRPWFFRKAWHPKGTGTFESPRGGVYVLNNFKVLFYPPKPAEVEEKPKAKEDSKAKAKGRKFQPSQEEMEEMSEKIMDVLGNTPISGVTLCERLQISPMNPVLNYTLDSLESKGQVELTFATPKDMGLRERMASPFSSSRGWYIRTISLKKEETKAEKKAVAKEEANTKEEAKVEKETKVENKNLPKPHFSREAKRAIMKRAWEIARSMSLQMGEGKRKPKNYLSAALKQAWAEAKGQARVA